MSTHKICFCGEIRKICGYHLLSGALLKSTDIILLMPLKRMLWVLTRSILVRHF